MLTVDRVSKHFGTVAAVREVSLTVAPGELLALVGPSGCGKTTLLRMIAGFESPSSGKLILHGTDITDQPPHLRRIGMVFQNYALFPHMTVRENIAFGLRAQGRTGDELRRRTDAAAERVQLSHRLEAPVPSLSGGEQQRVALARAIVTEPGVLLLDEPLSNLDPVLRDEMRTEIGRVQRETGLTTVYVTHDQVEALSLADRVVVMQNGVVEQCAAPREIFFNPATPFVASFMGGAQLAPGRLVVQGDLRGVRIGDGLVVTVDTIDPMDSSPLPDGSEVNVAIKPEALRIAPEGVAATVRAMTFAGPTTDMIVDVSGVVLRARVGSVTAAHIAVGDRITVSFDPALCRVFRK